MTFVAELDPRFLWEHFDRILTIPRGSKHEELARAFVLEIAERLAVEHAVDDVGNVVIRKPATKGREGAPVIVLQAHLDMVQEKNSDVDFDFARDPIRPVRDGEYLTADGTTLGADNGIGVAAMLALLTDEEISHGPLELLFTIDEETGLTGAGGLADDLLEGRTLINLDSEEEGVLTIGCAGGADSYVRLPVSSGPVGPGAAAAELTVAGLKGGHSGVDIHLGRGNAIRCLVRALRAAQTAGAVRLGGLRGGNAHNAIPREASATLVAADASALERALEAAAKELEVIDAEIASTDPDFRWERETVAAPDEAWDAASTERALALLEALPHGVLAMSHEIEGLVETSTNLAVVQLAEGALEILMSSRSSVASALEAVRRRIRAFGTLAGAEVREKDGYPGWKPDTSSRLLGVMREVYREVTGDEPEVGAVHAGLECGIIGEKYPGMDMISFGPQIEYPHSPDERVKVDSVAPFWAVLLATLDRLSS
jgi:dipeptidase D